LLRYDLRTTWRTDTYHAMIYVPPEEQILITLWFTYHLKNKYLSRCDLRITWRTNTYHAMIYVSPEEQILITLWFAYRLNNWDVYGLTVIDATYGELRLITHGLIQGLKNWGLSSRDFRTVWRTGTYHEVICVTPVSLYLT